MKFKCARANCEGVNFDHKTVEKAITSFSDALKNVNDKELEKIKRKKLEKILRR